MESDRRSSLSNHCFESQKLICKFQIEFLLAYQDWFCSSGGCKVSFRSCKNERIIQVCDVQVKCGAFVKSGNTPLTLHTPDIDRYTGTLLSSLFG